MVPGECRFRAIRLPFQRLSPQKITVEKPVLKHRLAAICPNEAATVEVL